MKIYISFGQSHVHVIGDKLFDRGCLAEIECVSEREGREIAQEFFGRRFATSYLEEDLEYAITFFSRGIVKLK